jgi:hypothetical protein
LVISNSQEDQPDLNILDSLGNHIDISDPSIIHYWASWNKASHRDIQIIQRFHQRHPEIQIIGVTEFSEDATAVEERIQRLGLYYTQGKIEELPRLPATILINSQQQLTRNNLNYEMLMSFFNKEH